MKLLTYSQGGAVSYGAVTGDGVVDLGKRLGQYPDLRSLLEAGALNQAAGAAKDAAADHALGDITFLPVIPNPDKIICVGLNYKAHREETGRTPTDNPALFMRFADTQTGHKEPMIKPNNSDAFDFEGELALIIGKTARHVSEADALDYIAGYACYNDGSVRDFQNHTPQWMPGKNFPATGAFGPWMVTADDIPDPTKLTLTTRLNGEVVQQSATDLLIFTIPVLMAYITSFTTLRPGDVISTGTPGGVGFRRKPPLFMKAGDTIEVDITDVGTLTNPIATE